MKVVFYDTFLIIWNVMKILHSLGGLIFNKNLYFARAGHSLHCISVDLFLSSSPTLVSVHLNSAAAFLAPFFHIL